MQLAVPKVTTHITPLLHAFFSLKLFRNTCSPLKNRSYSCSLSNVLIIISISLSVIIHDAKKVLQRLKWMDRQAVKRLSAVMGCDGEKFISLDRCDS